MSSSRMLNVEAGPKLAIPCATRLTLAQILLGNHIGQGHSPGGMGDPVKVPRCPFHFTGLDSVTSNDSGVVPELPSATDASPIEIDGRAGPLTVSQSAETLSFASAIATSRPCPHWSLSAPGPPTSVSFPGPLTSVSLPPSPYSLSLPPLPMIVSAFAVPRCCS